MDNNKITQTIVYPTRVLSYVYDNVKNLNKELRKIILDREKSTPGLLYSNRGGYHSSNDLLHWDYPCIKTFTDMIHEISERMARINGLKENTTVDLSLAAWANVMRDGNYHLLHNHPNNYWSGCYYVSVGNPDRNVPYNSFLELVDPRPAAVMIHSDAIVTPRYHFQPTDGMILIFPSFLEHLVHPFKGTGERISIAFNVGLKY